ncbi:NAD-dependent epimerase/dehydratase family protein [Pedobacter sp. HMF7647]|uniref:NAD-dependent epimerase/dehydratase family protein n=1 Tax=Hufsiella arboris TaxID=2695275 RepID=A0A7K1Y8V0_9SPHI|nr:NAD-dependent epimerase/dehydratase family protein [Hufsiella arboris]MXV50499.1 NAD-dependent epimerase/dehydratase family protein [Hufsiella arboris]
MKILVTGATGFIGQRLAIKLAKQGNEVHALCRDPFHPYLAEHHNVKPFKGDILDKQSLLNAIKDCTQVYHTAAMAKMWTHDKSEFHRVNVSGTRNVLEVAELSGIEKMVYTSSCGVIGPTINEPLSENDPRITGFPIDYERTKYLAELEVNNFAKRGFPVVTVNPSRVYGEGPVTDSNTVSKMVTGYLKGTWRIIPGNGEQIANYAYLDDVVNGHIAAMKQGKIGQRYILGGEDISFNSFFDVVQRVSGKKKRLYHLPQPVIKFYSYVEWLKTTLTGLPPVFLPEFADRLKYNQKYTSQKAIEQLTYKITPFEEGMERTVNYIRKCII